MSDTKPVETQRGWTFQANKKGVIPVEVKLDQWNKRYFNGKRLDAKGEVQPGHIYVAVEQFFLDPEEARQKLVEYHEETLKKHLENAEKTRASLARVRAQKLSKEAP
jgi:hypothetical protein